MIYSTAKTRESCGCDPERRLLESMRLSTTFVNNSLIGCCASGSTLSWRRPPWRLTVIGVSRLHGQPSSQFWILSARRRRRWNGSRRGVRPMHPSLSASVRIDFVVVVADVRKESEIRLLFSFSSRCRPRNALHEGNSGLLHACTFCVFLTLTELLFSFYFPSSLLRLGLFGVYEGLSLPIFCMSTMNESIYNQRFSWR